MRTSQPSTRNVLVDPTIFRPSTATLPETPLRTISRLFSRDLSATLICIADEIAGAAEMVMGKTTGVCAAIVRGAPVRAGRGAATEIVRPPRGDLFR